MILVYECCYLSSICLPVVAYPHFIVNRSASVILRLNKRLYVTRQNSSNSGIKYQVRSFSTKSERIMKVIFSLEDSSNEDRDGQEA